MRLSTDQVKAAILHENKEVRTAALQYFARSYSTDTTIMPTAVEALNRWGPTDAFVFAIPLADLAQTAATVDWAIGQLQHNAVDERADFQTNISRLLCRADKDLVLPQRETILESPGFQGELKYDLLERMRLTTVDSETLWSELEKICEGAKTKLYPNEMNYADAQRIADTLADDGSQADHMMALLQREFDPSTETAMTWLEIFLVRMAGKMRYEPAVTILVKKLHEDGEILDEQCVEALTRIGTDATVQAVRDAYPQAPSYFRLYASSVFGNIHSDVAVAAGIELLSLELDRDLRNWLAVALTDQFSTEGIDAARRVLSDGHDFPDLTQSLVTACKVMDYKVPELEQWERDLAEQSRRQRLARMAMAEASVDDFDDDLEVPTPRAATKTGRNDPCPCGSGKKFKKCCLNKHHAS